MRYEELEDTIRGVLGTNEIKKDGLIMVYELDEDIHRKLEEHIFFKNNPQAKNKDFVPVDDFEMDLGEFTILFVKKAPEEPKNDKKKAVKNKFGKKTNKKTWLSGIKSLFWGDEKDN